jgi:hypothetical protein
MEMYTPIPASNTYVRFQVLTAASIKFRVFWDVVPCSHIEVDQQLCMHFLSCPSQPHIYACLKYILFMKGLTKCVCTLDVHFTHSQQCS